MLDLKWIREHSQEARELLSRKNFPVQLDELLELDRQRRAILPRVESLRAEKKKKERAIGEAKQRGGAVAVDEREALAQASREVRDLEASVSDIERKVLDILLRIPNVPHESVPVAKDASGNRVVAEWGKPPKFSFEPKTHEELGAKLGWLDPQGAARVAGSGFACFTGQGARLVRALISFMLDLHVKKHGYQEVWPPALVRAECMVATGQLPLLEEDMYKLAQDDLFLAPTAEVPVTNLKRETTFEEAELPVKLCAYTPCFRREAGSYGKDTKGLARLHQFDKVELVQFVRPEDSLAALEELRGHAEAVLRSLELPYRTVLLATGDLSFAGAKCYDLEVWAPGAKRWLEVSSCSAFMDFQARRAHIRYKPKDNGENRYVHTLNGSGVALPRTIIGILENFQTEAGSVKLPAALAPYLA